ncbi:MAG: hypothetical protein ACLTQN_01875 [Blautia massiliensis (ex Durand et al. 2017)]
MYDYVQTISGEKKIYLSRSNVNSRLISNIQEKVTILDGENLTLLPKAVKNETEIQNEKIAHIKDGVAMVKFIHWLKRTLENRRSRSSQQPDKLYDFRSEQEKFFGKQF